MQSKEKNLIIDNDGYISMSEGNNKQIMEAVDISKDNWHIPYPFIVDSVFQKFGVKNANGRIYPENILKREVEKYQQKINEHRALGECYSDDAMILTNDGWKSIVDVKEGELVLTLNVDTNKIEVKPIIRKIEYDYDGELIHIQNRNINDVVTPNHKYPIYSCKNNFKGFFTAEDIFKQEIKYFFIPNFQFNSDLKIIKFKKINLKQDNTIVEKIQYKGKVYCIEVENHTWYVKQNKKCHWTGNCNHPAETSIDLGRVSHNIIELHWEGRTLVGKMELNVTKGFVTQGICSSLGDTVANLLINGYKIGVSSRGVGSVENRMGAMVVGNDFELICFDIVADPSTPNAYIYSKEEEKAQYIENKVNNSEKLTLSEKIKYANELLN